VVWLVGCGGEQAPAGTETVQAEAPPPPSSVKKPAQPAQVAQVVTVTHPLPLPFEPVEPERTPSPRSVSQVAAGAYSPGELATWATHPGLQPNLRLTALRRLERDDPEQAVSVALELVRSKDPKHRLLRINAVAVLARSRDPRAERALKHLDPDLERLAQAVGRPR